MLDTLTIPDDGPIICTLYGDAGTGKTTLAATFPKPVFIRVEDGLKSIPRDKRPQAFPVVQEAGDILKQINTLRNEDHDFKTLVIDSVTAAETHFIKHIVDNDPKKPASINQAMGGYGNGLAAVAAMHNTVRRACGLLSDEKGMNIVFIAHATVDTLTPPDMDPYTRYTLNLDKRGLKPYNDNVDLVGFLRLQTITTGDGDRKKALSNGKILLTVRTMAANISKNRYGITDDLVVVPGENPLIEFIPSLGVK